ncbi:MAG: glycosyltransferase family 2 protein [PVC group bacterium]
MSILLKEGIFFAVSAILAIYWLIKLALLFYRLRIDPCLSTEPEEAPGGPLISIVIAVRDEERNIEDCIRSFQKQTYRNWEMIIVDDRSRDRTAEIVQGLLDGDPRIRLIKNTENPPASWSAQVYANGKGVTESRGEWLVFTDADTRHHPAHLQSALAYCLRNRAEVLTILPGQICRGFWENTLQPFIFWLFWDYFPPRSTNKKTCRRAGASGTFFLVRRGAYETIGGWASVHNTIPDDVAFMERAKSLGLNAHLVIATRTLQVRMYQGFRESFDGWSRYMLSGANNNILIALCEILYALAFNLLPFLFPFFIGRYPFTALLLAFSALLIVVIRFAVNRLLGAAGWGALTHPAASLMLAAISLNTLYRRITGKGVRWKGRIYLEEGRSIFWTGKEYRVKE